MAATTIPYHVNATGHGCSSANVRANVFSMKAQRSTAFMCPSPACALLTHATATRLAVDLQWVKIAWLAGAGAKLKEKMGDHLPPACGVAVAQPPPLPQCRTLPNPPQIGTHHLLQQSRHGPRPPRTRNRARRGRVSTDHVIVQPVICN